ncbi:unnamed protein product [Polarella glacialis]|uniref:MalT-like TPR region domain-containing protein n=1 Tax=Polarella glacialis TaxID=89957 RepID=A0A813GE80_POLGL|nr:unnamed protein product [Polarella glacialis]
MHQYVEAGFWLVGPDQSDGLGVTDALRSQVLALRSKGLLKNAHAAAFEQLGQFRACGDTFGEAKTLLILAHVNHDKRGSANRERAFEWALQARQIFAERGDAKLEAEALLALVNIVMKRRGDRRQAAEETKQLVAAALPLLHSAGDLRGEGVAMHNLACAYALSAAWERAAGAAQKARAMFGEAKLRKLEAFELHCAAIWYMMDEDPREAAEAAEEAMGIYLEDSMPMIVEIFAAYKQPQVFS